MAPLRFLRQQRSSGKNRMEQLKFLREAALAPPTNKTHQKNYGANADEESSSWVTSQAGREVVAWLPRWSDRVLGLTGRDRGCCVRLQGAPTCYGSAWVVDRTMKMLGWLDSVAGEVGA